MSDNQLSVNTDGIASAVPGVVDIGNQIAGVLTTLQGTLAGLGEPWGDDGPGQAFAAQYHGPRQQIEDTLSSSRDVLHSTADGITTMAKGFAVTEEQNDASVATTGGDPGLPAGHTDE
jgi:uncharacterized protein YukE